MNESVLAMIAKLHARLDDLADVVREIPFELSGYEKRLDRIDDQVYLIEVELDKKLDQARPLDALTPEQSQAFDAAKEGGQGVGAEKDTVHIVSEGASEDAPSKVKITSKPDEGCAATEHAPSEKVHAEEGGGSADKKQEGFLTDSAKETIAGATKTLNSLYKDGKEVMGEFSEAFGDIKEVLGKNPFKRR